MRQILSTEAFIEWLELSPETRFDCTDPWDCAFMRYLTVKGIEANSVDSTYWYQTYEGEGKLLPWIEYLPDKDDPYPHSPHLYAHTYGELASELRKLLSCQ